MDIHTLDGTDNPMTPLFTWHGFQYVQGRGDSGAEIDFAKVGQGFTGLVAGMKLEDSLVNRSLAGGEDVDVMNGVFELARRSQRSNLAGERIAHIHPGPLLTCVCAGVGAAGFPTDCPTREKHGWLGDALNTVDLQMTTLW